MNIQNWGIGRIMELPDWCFGRRFMVSCALDLAAATRAWDISEVALPEWCVIWELFIVGTGDFGKEISVRIALGDQLPAVVAVFDALDPLFMGLGVQGAEPRYLNVNGVRELSMRRLRMPVAANGRRLVIEGLTPEAKTGSLFVAIIVSGVPKEVPDWLVSVNLRSR